MTQERTRRWLLSLCWAVASTCLPALAEVAVAVSGAGDGTEQTVIPYTLSILDDQDPIGSMVWIPFNRGIDTRVLLNPAGFENGDGPPSVARRSVAGIPVVAWSRNSPAGFDIVVSAFLDGAWTDPEVVAGSTVDELDPALVIDPATGAVHLLYWVADTEARVMLRTAPADLSAWSAPVRVSLFGESATHPAGVVDAGTLRIVYESEAGASRNIVLATWTDDAFVTEAVSTVNLESSAVASRPAVNVIGRRLWVEWIDGAGEMAWTSRVGESPWSVLNTETFSDAEDREFQVRSRIRAEVRSLEP